MTFGPIGLKIKQATNWELGRLKRGGLVWHRNRFTSGYLHVATAGLALLLSTKVAREKDWATARLWNMREGRLSYSNGQSREKRYKCVTSTKTSSTRSAQGRRPYFNGICICIACSLVETNKGATERPGRAIVIPSMFTMRRAPITGAVALPQLEMQLQQLAGLCEFQDRYVCFSQSTDSLALQALILH